MRLAECSKHTKDFRKEASSDRFENMILIRWLIKAIAARSVASSLETIPPSAASIALMIQPISNEVEFSPSGHLHRSRRALPVSKTRVHRA